MPKVYDSVDGDDDAATKGYVDSQVSTAARKQIIPLTNTNAMMYYVTHSLPGTGPVLVQVFVDDGDIQATLAFSYVVTGDNEITITIPEEAPPMYSYVVMVVR